jgi:hypothetical protein
MWLLLMRNFLLKLFINCRKRKKFIQHTSNAIFISFYSLQLINSTKKMETYLCRFSIDLIACLSTQLYNQNYMLCELW